MKLNELFRKQPVNEVFGGQGSAFARKMGAALNPTQVGAGARDLEKKTDNLFNAWQQFRGTTKAVPNSANVEKWIKTTMGLDDPEIWKEALAEFSEQNPDAGEKFKDLRPLDSAEISNFFNKLIQVRLMNPDRKLFSTRPRANAAGGGAGQATDGSNAWKVWEKDKKQKSAGPSELDTAGFAPHTTAGKTDDSTNVHHEPNAFSQAHPTEEPTAQPTGPRSNEPAPPSFAYSYNRKPSAAATPAAVTPEEGPGNAGNIDWNEIRNRFPAAKKMKPRISVPMDSNVVPDKPRFRVPAGSSKV